MTHEQGRVRYVNFKHPRGYCDRVAESGPLWCEVDWLTSEAERTEKIMMGLRLNEGLIVSGLNLDRKAVDEIINRGWAVESKNRLTLTGAGRHFCSEAALMLMD